MKKSEKKSPKKNRQRNFQKYHEAILYLESLANIPMKHEYMRDRQQRGVYLKRMRYFLNMLSNPDKGFKYIHITGTAGKGSVTNIVHEILYRSGKRVGSMMSPFVSVTIEKIKYGGAYIDPLEFATIVESMKPFIDKAYTESPYGRPSYFEIIFAAALVYFKKRKCEWVVLEAGCGGRYDYTNVIEKSAITAITNVDLDHTEILGDTREKIAYEKAGIIKHGSVFFTTESRPSVLAIFSQICRQKNVAMNILAAKKNSFEEANQSLAEAICRQIGISQKYIIEGIKNARLPARFEIVQQKPSIVVDGAHNPIKMKCTVENIKKLKEKIKYKKLFLIIAIAGNKDSRTIAKEIAPSADYVLVTRFLNAERKPVLPHELAEYVRLDKKKSARVEICLDPHTALKKALHMASGKDLIVITGSFYLAGELRKHWFPVEKVLKTRNSF